MAGLCWAGALGVHAQDSDAWTDLETLVVSEPEALTPRDPEKAVDGLLRAEMSILEALETLELELDRRETELKTLKTRRDLLETDFDRSRAEFARLTTTLENSRRLVRTRLRAMIQLKRTEPYQILFSAKDYGSFLRKRRAMETLLDADRARIQAYRGELAAWEVAKTDLERRKANLGRTQERIANTIQSLKWDTEEKQILLQAVEEKRAYYAKAGREMGSVDDALSRHVRELRDEARGRLWFEESKGRLPMPIWKGKIIGRFGVRTHRSFKTRTVHHGIDIVPGGGKPKKDVKIKAIYWGYVAYTGWVRGLGKTVILDHSRGFMSLYAHLDSFDVTVGEKVKTGQRLGAMGDSGSLNGRRLYLEIRKDGKAINPSPWLR